MGRRRTFTYLVLLPLLMLQVVACKRNRPRGGGNPGNGAARVDDGRNNQNQNQNQNQNLNNLANSNLNQGIDPNDFNALGLGNTQLIDPSGHGSRGFDPSGTGQGSVPGERAALADPLTKGQDPSRAAVSASGGAPEGKPAGSTEVASAKPEPAPGGVREPLKVSAKEEFERELAKRTNSGSRDLASEGGTHDSLGRLRRRVTDAISPTSVNLPSPKIAEFPSTQNIPDYIKTCAARRGEGASVNVPHIEDAHRDGHGHYASQSARTMSIHDGRVRIAMTLDLSYPNLGLEGKKQKILDMEQERAYMVEFFADQGIELDLTFQHDPPPKGNVFKRAWAKVFGNNGTSQTDMNNWGSNANIFSHDANGKYSIQPGREMGLRERAMAHCHELCHKLGLHDEYAAITGDNKAQQFENDSIMKYPYGKPKLYPRHFSRMLGPLCGV